ncbi:hypothetical protein L7F22_047899 [Adiantum nelumboides]|nr:hypothetical protein [Adiantum nelumboides]
MSLPHEDYWEDASVCVGCVPHSHGWFSFPTFIQEKEQAEPDVLSVYPTDSMLYGVPSSDHLDMQANSLLQCAIPACSLAPRVPHQFPPPIALSSTLSIKQGGRFVLKDMCTLHPPNCSCLRAERQHGRLRLHLVEDDIMSSSNFSSSSACSQPLEQDEEHREEYMQALDEDNKSICSSGLHEDSDCMDQVATVENRTRVDNVEHPSDGRQESNDPVCSVSEETQEFNVDTMRKFSKEDHPGRDVLKHFGGDDGIHRPLEEKPIVWASFDDKVGDHDVQASLNSPCSSNKVLLQQSFARTGTAIGLAAVS